LDYTVSDLEDSEVTPAELIAANLAALPHPDGTPRQLPGFSTQLLPEAMQQQVQNTAKELGEAIINLLEVNGWTVTNQPIPESEPEPPQTANVHCTLCDQKLFTINLINPSHTLTNGNLFIAGMKNLKPECPHQ
jgi:hypothetical protein